MLSGLNNIHKYSILDYKYSRHYGVNQQELDLLLNHFNIDDNQRDKIKYWYSGYEEIETGTGKVISKYNIWSIVNYLNDLERRFEAYWEESGSIEFIDNLLKNKAFLDKMNRLIDGESISLFILRVDFDISDFETLKEIDKLNGDEEICQNGFDVLFSYLFITGYMTQDANRNYIFPNEEIKHKMRRKVIRHYKHVYRLDYEIPHKLSSILKKIFERKQSNNSGEERLEFIRKSFDSNFQQKFGDLIKTCRLVSEKSCTLKIFANVDSVHSILNFIGMQVRDILFGSEIYTKKIVLDEKGRVDIVFHDRQTGIIIEVKYEGKALEALTQAKTYEDLISDQDEQVFIGIAVSSSRVVSLAGKIIIGNKVQIF